MRDTRVQLSVFSRAVVRSKMRYEEVGLIQWEGGIATDGENPLYDDDYYDDDHYQDAIYNDHVLRQPGLSPFLPPSLPPPSPPPSLPPTLPPPPLPGGGTAPLCASCSWSSNSFLLHLSLRFLPSAIWCG